MHLFKVGLKAILVGTLMAFSLMPAMAQDKLALQAPVGKKMRAIDSVALQRLIGDEELENPAYSLYPEWNNTYVHRYVGVELPTEYKIDLRNFCMPTERTKITSRYGYRPRFRRYHKGIDVKVYIGDTIRAAFDGKVRIVAFERRGYGNYVVIRHPNGLETVYGHLSRHLVKANEVVKAGEPIGLGGNTGRSTGSHLHFETRLLGEPINPEYLFNFEAQDVTCDYYMFRANGSGYAMGPHSGSKVTLAQMEAEAQKAAKAKESRNFQVEKRTRAAAQIHRVRKGESLYVIAKKHGITVNKLCKLNRISTTTTLRPGQILRLS